MTSVAARALGVGARLFDRASGALDDGARVARFLRGRLLHEPRADDVFVATYPRSGTTLVQWMMLVLTHGGEPPECAHVSEVSPWFERDLAIGARDAADLARLPSPRIYKTHLTAEWVPRRARCIAVVRDPRDVAVSYFHLYRDYLAFAGDFDAFFARFMAGDLQYGSWFSHVAGWRARAARDPLTTLVRYEDIVADRAGTADSLARFAGLEVSAAVVAGAAEHTTFDAMKAREPLFDHATALLLERGVRPRAFVRGGRVGDGGTVLSPDKVDAVRRAERAARPARTVRLAAFLQ